MMDKYIGSHALMSAGKNLVVIIPGSDTKLSRFSLLNNILNRFYRHYGVSIESNDRWLEELSNSFKNSNTDTFIFTWSGGVSPFAVQRAVSSLKIVLTKKKSQYKSITLFAKSLGGSIAERVSRDTGLPVGKIIYIASPHFVFRKDLPKTIKAVNIYSEADSYQRLGNRFLYLGLGKVKISDGVNIDIPGLRHSDFNENKMVEWKNSQTLLFNMYNEIVQKV